MKLEDQVCSLELATSLRDLEAKQVSAFYWAGDGKVFYGDANEVPLKLPHTSAFTVAELGEMLSNGQRGCWKDGDNKWRCSWTYSPAKDRKGRPDTFEADTEADARAKMLIYLIENKLV